ncbi:hypothetical protein PS15m_001546 [Mucor circinelloides]
MANPFNTSDANVPFEQGQDDMMLTPHVSDTHNTTIVTPEKHLLYVEDYDTMPPSYSVAQQQGQQTVQRSNVEEHEATFGDDYDDSRLNEESAPLMPMTTAMEDDDYHYAPTAPSMNQMELGLQHDLNGSSKSVTAKKRWTLYRAYLAFSIFAIGITLMSAILATIDCYNSCNNKDKDSCDKCPKVWREGFTAFCYITFILSSIAGMGKIAQRILS